MDVKITALPASAGLALADLLAVVDDPSGTPATQKATLTQLKTLLDTLYAPITGGAYVLKAGDTMTGLLTIAQATANTTALAVSGFSLTGANVQSMASFAGTWNTSGAPTAWSMNITDTASGSGSFLADWKVNGVSQFSIEKTGIINHTNTIMFAMTADNTPMFGGPGVLISGAASTVVANFNSLLFTTGTPIGLRVEMTDFGASGAETKLFSCLFGGEMFSIRKDGLVRVFNRINFLGDTSSFPSLKRSAAILQARLADDSAYCDFSARILRVATAFTVATLPAAGTQGRIAYVTDALAPAFLTTVVGGGAIITTVFDNGTNWVAV